MKLILSCLLILVTFSTAAHADEVITVAGKSVVASPPDGYVKVDNDKLIRIFQDFVPSTNKLEAAYLTSVDDDALKNGKQPDLQNYLMVQSIRATQEDYSENDFKVFRDFVLKQIDETLQSIDNKEISRQIQENIKKDIDADSQISIGKPVNLGVVYNDEKGICFEMMAHYQASMKGENISAPMIVGNCTLLLNNKIILSYAFSPYKNKEDIETVKARTIDWAQQLTKLNPDQAVADTPSSQLLETPEKTPEAALQNPPAQEEKSNVMVYISIILAGVVAGLITVLFQRRK